MKMYYLFASAHFEKVGNQNNLNDEHVNKIVISKQGCRG